MAWQPVVRAHEPGMAPPPIAPAEWVTEVQTLQELVPMAHENLAKEHWDYLVGGSETETTVKRNRLAIEEIGLRPRVLRRVPQIELGATVLGQPLSLPLILAPIGGLEAFADEGAATAADAAAEAGVMMCLSSACQPGPVKTAAAAPPGSPKIFQLYVRGDREFIAAQVATAQANDYQVFCLTVDTQLYSRRERDVSISPMACRHALSDADRCWPTVPQPLRQAVARAGRRRPHLPGRAPGGAVVGRRGVVQGDVPGLSAAAQGHRDGGGRGAGRGARR